MVEFAEGRPRPINYQNVCHTIADSYPEGVAHGVQKDAIQNSVDARAGSAAVNVLFSLEETGKGRFLTVADSGTKGLTGPVLDQVEEYVEELPTDSHWARFESFAFTKDEPDAIGARGQGKFIFLCASSEFKMFYDTLRPDGIYRLGATQARTTGCPILPGEGEEPWEGDTAQRILWDNCELHPLTEVGTRIIIVNPTGEVVGEFESGFVTSAIRETWFREIEKERLKVAIRLGGELTEVELVSPYPVPETDSEGVQSWVLGTDFDEDTIGLATGEEYRVKHFSAAHLSGPALEPETQGIAIIHNGMKIMSLPASMFPPHLRERCTGYVEFDRSLDRELRKGTNQHPNHYDLKWRRRLPQGIKQYIADRLSEFGKAKLGMGVDPREQRRARRSTAEEWAMRQLYKFAPDLDLFGKKGRPLHPSVPIPNVSKTVGVTIHHFTFPDPEIAPRINYGDSFDGLRLSAFNRSSEALDCAVNLSVLRGDSVVQVLVDRRSFSLHAASEEELGTVSLNIDPDTFDEAGLYRLKASLYEMESGERLDQVTRRFWVETDPPLKRPFELEPTPSFPEPYQHRQWLTSGQVNNSPTLHYNTTHPAYRVAEDDEVIDDYMVGIVLEGAIQFILQRPDSEEGTPDYHPLHTEEILGNGLPTPTEDVPNTSYREIMNYLSEVRWRMFT